MHAVEVILGIIRCEWGNDFHRIAELLEGDACPVQAGAGLRLDPVGRFDRLPVQIVRGLQQPRR
jgi:hypothetical protein